MKTERSIGKNVLLVVMLAALIANGGFFDYSVALVGALIVIALFIMQIKGESFYRKDAGIVFLIPNVITGIAFIVTFWSIDFMDNLMGVMRLVVVCLWMWLIRCRDQEEIRFTRNCIPVLGCINILVSVLSYCIPYLKPFFWENSRMSGFFQYANTNALFAAIGLMILVHNWKGQKKITVFFVQIFILLSGLLLTGSRSILVFLMIWGIWYAFQTVEFRKPFLFAVLLLVIFSGLFAYLTKNTGNIGRIFTIFKSNSTLWGRLLYDRDALSVLIKKFYGLGRMGYYYSQGTFQSGVYHIKFVHNDFLQIALDYGILALLLLLFFVGWQIIKGKQGRKEKEILLFLCASSFVDFHCQYLLILMIAALFLDYGECVKEKKTQLRENYVILPVVFLIFVYTGIATGFCKMGNQDMALSMLPDYTYAQEQKMISCMGTQESYEIASELIQKNQYNITAYITRGSFYASQLRVPECIDDLNRMLELDPYNVEYYKQYETLLRNVQAQMNEVLKGSDDQSAGEIMELLQERIDSLPEQLESLQERTSSLAYKIKDKPVFSYQ